MTLYQLLFLLNYEDANFRIDFHDRETLVNVIKFIELVHVRHFDPVLRKRFLQRLFSDAYEEEILHYLILLGCPSHIFSLKNQLLWLFKFALGLADEREGVVQDPMKYEQMCHLINNAPHLPVALVDKKKAEHQVMRRRVRRDYVIQLREFPRTGSHVINPYESIRVWNRTLIREMLFHQPVGKPGPICITCQKAIKGEPIETNQIQVLFQRDDIKTCIESNPPNSNSLKVTIPPRPATEHAKDPRTVRNDATDRPKTRATTPLRPPRRYRFGVNIYRTTMIPIRTDTSKPPPIPKKGSVILLYRNPKIPWFGSQDSQQIIESIDDRRCLREVIAMERVTNQQNIPAL